MAPCVAISVARLVVIPLPTALKWRQSFASAAKEADGTSAARPTAVASTRDFIEIDIASSWRVVFIRSAQAAPGARARQAVLSGAAIDWMYGVSAGWRARLPRLPRTSFALGMAKKLA
jgi:hypothetical protein